jgi:hypothetical protein
MKNPVTPPGIDPGNVRLVAQRLNHYATPGPISGKYFNEIKILELSTQESVVWIVSTLIGT